MTKNLAGSLAVLLLTTSLGLGQVSLGPPVPEVSPHGIQPVSYTTPSIWPVAAPPPPPPAPIGSPYPPPAPPPPPYDPLPPACGSPVCCEPCVPRIWGSAEYLLWWVKDGTFAPTGDNLYYGTFSGVRVNVGGWINADRTLGIEGGGFLLERRADSFDTIFATPAIPFLGLPAGTFAGEVFSTTRLWGFEANGLLNVARSECYHLDLLAGFRNVSLEENVLMQGFTTPGPAGFAANFQTQNWFYGPQIGAKAGVRFGRFTTDLIGKIAFGVTHEAVNLTAFTAGPPPVGVVVRDTNNMFAVVPEVQLQLGYEFNRYIRTFVGYNFLYVSNVVRPGDQVTLTSPFPFVTTDFWAHGVNFGLELRW